MAFHTHVAPIAAAVGLFIGGVAGAAETNTAPKAEAATGPTPVELLVTARDLYAIALADRDPVLAIAAAKLAAQSEGAEGGLPEAATEPVAADAPAGAEGADRAVAPGLEDMLAAARDLAGEDAALIAMIDAIGSGATRGPVGGSKYSVTTVRARSIDRFRVEFRAGERATVAIDGGGDGDLDLAIFDESGNEICVRAGRTDREACSWTPRWTGIFTIAVVNQDRFDNRYRLDAY